MLRAVWLFITLVGATLIIALTGVVVGLGRPSLRVADGVMRRWSRALLSAAGVRLRCEGTEHVADGVPAFFVGNHQSALDIPILAAALRGRVRFLAKKALFEIPVFGWILRVYGHAEIDRSNARAALKSLNEIYARIQKRPSSFALFPEGTRSTDGRMLPFRRGALKICQRGGLPVVPFAIDGSVSVLKRGEYRVRGGVVRLVFCPPIPAAEVAALSQDELTERVRSAIAKALGQCPSVEAECTPAPGAVEEPCG